MLISEQRQDNTVDGDVTAEDLRQAQPTLEVASRSSLGDLGGVLVDSVGLPHGDAFSDVPVRGEPHRRRFGRVGGGRRADRKGLDVLAELQRRFGLLGVSLGLLHGLVILTLKGLHGTTHTRGGLVVLDRLLGVHGSLLLLTNYAEPNKTAPSGIQ